MAAGKPRKTGLDDAERGGRYVTLQDVARRAGVSPKTVSRVVNAQGEISESTRARIQAAIDELGYRPNVLARSLTRHRTNTLAAVVWGIDYFGPSRTVIGIEKQAEELGYSLILSLVMDPEHHDHQRILDTLLSRRVDGIIWAVPEVGDNHDWIDPDSRAHLPPMVFLSAAARSGVTVIAADNRGGGRRATEHLIHQGRRNIGMLTGPLAWWEARERREGWRLAAEQAGLDASADRAAECHWSAAAGQLAMQELIERHPDLDGVFSASDQIALGAMAALAASGRSVPADVAIVGFDDIPEAPYFRPALTTMHQKLVDVGRRAVQQLHEAIGASRSEQPGGAGGFTVVETELVVRGSST